MLPRSPTFCSRFHKAIELIGGRWAGAILRELLNGPSRFAELRAAIPDINDRMLSERLKELEREGLVERRVLPAAPVRVEYELTEKGRALEKTLRSVAAWAEEWIPLEEAGRGAIGKKKKA
jgi:DNA-binding HxlR family transcriptional regulator